ncbi:hypothetical protein A9Q84_00050 [Halobacteriovorax marinus]|uniref:AAA domain-containing protein n=1 Tax=Halobacteriovorax marinus TaxID=97084 RepID=A0A1Y5FDH6_9BACT|nr:hypothetical protein A9Q84_00050 [Halobacteriovorax marinus]
MITATQLRNAMGLQTNESILKFLDNLPNSEDLSYKRGRSQVLEPEFFQQYLKSSRKNPIKNVHNKIVSIANNKGGVGKTSTTALVAYKASGMGYKTIVIDSDPQGNLTNYLLGEEYEAEYSLYDVFKGYCTVKEALVKVSNNLYIIPSTLDNEFISEAVSAVALPKMLKSNIVGELDADLFLIDTNPSLSDMNLAIHSIADMILTIVNNDSSSVKGLKHVLSKLEQLGYEGSIKAVFNKIDGRENLAQVTERITPLIEKFNFSICSKYMRIDNEIKNAQMNINGAMGVMDMSSKCQTDSLSITLDVLNDLSRQSEVLQ